LVLGYETEFEAALMRRNKEALEADWMTDKITSLFAQHDNDLYRRYGTNRMLQQMLIAIAWNDAMNDDAMVVN
jgi:hypothetical protein